MFVNDAKLIDRSSNMHIGQMFFINFIDCLCMPNVHTNCPNVV
jgi:hypothetical protein